MTAHNKGSKENKYGQQKEHNNTHCVVNALVVFCGQKHPQIIEEFSNVLHGLTRALALRKLYVDILRNKWSEVFTTCHFLLIGRTEETVAVFCPAQKHAELSFHLHLNPFFFNCPRSDRMLNYCSGR